MDIFVGWSWRLYHIYSAGCESRQAGAGTVSCAGEISGLVTSASTISSTPTCHLHPWKSFGKKCAVKCAPGHCSSVAPLPSLDSCLSARCRWRIYTALRFISGECDRSYAYCFLAAAAAAAEAAAAAATAPESGFAGAMDGRGGAIDISGWMGGVLAGTGAAL